jgi:hypothetical protein
MSHPFHIPKPRKKAKKRRGMARPDEPLAVYCEVGRAGICSGRTEHRHHRLMRSQGGGDEAGNTVDVCGPCHTWIHANPSVAYAHGFLLHRGTA